MPTVIRPPTCRNPLIQHDLDAPSSYAVCIPSAQSEENLYGQSNSADCKALTMEGRVSPPVRRAELDDCFSHISSVSHRGRLPLLARGTAHAVLDLASFPLTRPML